MGKKLRKLEKGFEFPEFFLFLDKKKYLQDELREKRDEKR